MTTTRQYDPEIKSSIEDEVCYYCGRKLNKQNKTIDHVIPIKQGGKNDKLNLVACCSECNTIKGAFTIPQLLVDIDKQLRFCNDNPVRAAKLKYYKEIFSIAKKKLKERG